MKQLLLIFFLTFSLPTMADDRNWQKSEHNVNIKHNNFGLNIRQYAQDDYDHIQFQYKLMKNVNVALRLAEEGDVKEKRPIITHKINNYISHRLEYRTYESDLKSDYMRYRVILGAKYKMLWAKVQPRWKVGGEGVHVDEKIDDIKTAVGLTIKLNEHTTFKPYVEYLADSEINDFKKQYMMLGTALTFKF
ncbi:MAG: hypothetical protein VW270_16345 [Candidatus Poseidoniales archaeon]|jgi:hypothetical protein